MRRLDWLCGERTLLYDKQQPVRYILRIGNSLICVFLVQFNTYSQDLFSIDSTKTFESPEPARNRLFTMSTGRTMPTGKLSVADFEILLVQMGYAPMDFFQLNLSYLISFSRGSNPYWSIGTKVQVLQPSGVFQGLCLGADFGFFGNEDYITLQTHIHPLPRH